MLVKFLLYACSILYEIDNPVWFWRWIFSLVCIKIEWLNKDYLKMII